MKVFERYIFKNLSIATVLVTVTLVMVIFLSQSLKFLELVLDSGASSLSFWLLTVLAMPRFFEIIMPLSIMAATIFIYNRMTMDSEIVVMRSVGLSPYALARPALIVASVVTVFLWSVTFWLAPQSMSGVFSLQDEIKNEFSAALFHEGVFNQVRNGLTVYIRDRGPNGDLRGVMIYDGRDEQNPSVIMAKRGTLSYGDNHEVIVYDGSRQKYQPTTGKTERLNFERYTVELPDINSARRSWLEPEERTIYQLLTPDMNNPEDRKSLKLFRSEAHRRLTAPLLSFTFTALSCASLLLGRYNRRGQSKRIAFSVGSAVLLQGLFLASYNLARHQDFAIVLMYLIALCPAGMAYALLRGYGEQLQRKFPATWELFAS